MMVFDLETYADHTAIEFLAEPEAPSNYKNQDAIDKYKAEARVKQIASMALDPTTCRIVAIGVAVGDTVSVTVCPDVEVERTALARFWDAFDTTRHTIHDGRDYSVDVSRASDVVGFNCAGFDLPVLLTRSCILGVPAPKILLRKYGSPDCRDLMLELSLGGMLPFKSLNFWCKRLGLAVPEDQTSGKDMAALVEAGEWTGVAKHCEVDVRKTLRLAEYLNRL